MPTATATPPVSLAAVGALGDPTRRAIFERLAEGPMAVADLAARFPISRPAVSQHLAVLKEARLVRDQPDGRRRIYRVDPAGIEAIHAYLDQFWARSLAAFKQAAEAPDATSPTPPITPTGDRS